MKIKFKKNCKGFHEAVSEAVNNYFIENKKDKKANYLMYFKSIFYFSCCVISYTSLLAGNNSLWINNLLWIILCVSSVLLAVNAGHDAIHRAYSNKTWVNNFMANTYNLLGANAYIWSIQHNIVHHTFTNIHGIDEDIDSVPFARFSPTHKWKPIQRYQHIWVFMLYSLGSLSWVFSKDYKKFFQKKIGNHDNIKHPPIEYFKLFFFKFLYYILFIVLPVLIIDMPWYTVFGGFILGHLFEGLLVATIFALAHVVEKTQFPIPDQNGLIENNWAVHQMYTTANFGRKSTLTRFITGGLNFQVEHHLFPDICHVHYPVISEIVKQKAKEFGIPYNDYPSFWAALRSHFILLKKFGNPKVELQQV
jgi:linoleoyl-CoA desaturase